MEDSGQTASSEAAKDAQKVTNTGDFASAILVSLDSDLQTAALVIKYIKIT